MAGVNRNAIRDVADIERASVAAYARNRRSALSLGESRCQTSQQGVGNPASLHPGVLSALGPGRDNDEQRRHHHLRGCCSEHRRAGDGRLQKHRPLRSEQCAGPGFGQERALRGDFGRRAHGSLLRWRTGRGDAGDGVGVRLPKRCRRLAGGRCVFRPGRAPHDSCRREHAAHLQPAIEQVGVQSRLAQGRRAGVGDVRAVQVFALRAQAHRVERRRTEWHREYGRLPPKAR